jgi:hypothetical protein
MRYPFNWGRKTGGWFAVSKCGCTLSEKAMEVMVFLVEWASLSFSFD